MAGVQESFAVQYGKRSAYVGRALAALRALSGLTALTAMTALTACGAPDSQPGKLNHVQLLQKITQIAGESNAASPATVDPDTRLDGAKVGPGLRLTVRYTLVNAESQGVSSATFEAKLAAMIKDGSCKNTELRPLIDQGVVVALEYRGKDGSPLGTVSVDRDTCAATR